MRAVCSFPKHLTFFIHQRTELKICVYVSAKLALSLEIELYVTFNEGNVTVFAMCCGWLPGAGGSRGLTTGPSILTAKQFFCLSLEVKKRKYICSGKLCEHSNAIHKTRPTY